MMVIIEHQSIGPPYLKIVILTTPLLIFMISYMTQSINVYI